MLAPARAAAGMGEDARPGQGGRVAHLELVAGADALQGQGGHVGAGHEGIADAQLAAPVGFLDHQEGVGTAGSVGRGLEDGAVGVFLAVVVGALHHGAVALAVVGDQDDARVVVDAGFLELVEEDHQVAHQVAFGVVVLGQQAVDVEELAFGGRIGVGHDLGLAVLEVGRVVPHVVGQHGVEAT